MLDNLIGLQPTRVALPEEKPRWLDLVIEIERTAFVEQGQYYTCTVDGREMPIYAAVRQIPNICMKDLDLYLRMGSFLDKEVPKDSSKGFARPYITSTMLESIMGNSSHEAYIDGSGAYQKVALFRLNVIRDLVLDNFECDSILQAPYDERSTVVISNSRCSRAVSDVTALKNASFILANTSAESLLTFDEVAVCDFLMIVNSIYDDLFMPFDPHFNHKVIFNSKKRDIFHPGNILIQYDQCMCDSGPYPQDIQSEVYGLCSQMKGKDGREIYRLGKEIMKILKRHDKHA